MSLHVDMKKYLVVDNYSAMGISNTFEVRLYLSYSLDTADVKERCRLSLNLAREEQRFAMHRTETLR